MTSDQFYQEFISIEIQLWKFLLKRNHIISIWENKEYIDIRAEIIECSNLFEQFLNAKKENKDNIEINNKDNNNIASNERQINIGIVRTINSTKTNNI